MESGDKEWKDLDPVPDMQKLTNKFWKCHLILVFERCVYEWVEVEDTVNILLKCLSRHDLPK